jgi:pyruvate formate lyase activating enzyme
MIPIKGFVKTSLVDFTPYTSSTIFLAGCNFRCRYCHNPDIVLNYNSIKDIKEEEVLNYIEGKKQWVDGVCISGGEPTLYPELIDFASRLKEKGFLVKIDTNGTNPGLLKGMIEKKLVDRIAMDIKANLDKYDEVAEVNVDKDKIQKSIELIRNSGIEYEFRTTVIPGIVGKKEIFLIGKWLKGSKRFAIQNFRGGVNLIDNNLKEMKGYSKEELDEMKKIASEYFDEVEIRS